jgi:hypothetical protein
MLDLSCRFRVRVIVCANSCVVDNFAAIAPILTILGRLVPWAGRYTVRKGTWRGFVEILCARLPLRLFPVSVKNKILSLFFGLGKFCVSWPLYEHFMGCSGQGGCIGDQVGAPSMCLSPQTHPSYIMHLLSCRERKFRQHLPAHLRILLFWLSPRLPSMLPPTCTFCGTGHPAGHVSDLGW